MQLLRFFLGFVLFSGSILSAQAQMVVFGTEWTTGKLVLTDSEDTLQGTIRFELENNIAQLYLTNNTVKTYAARQIKWLTAHDPASMTTRHFYALPYAMQSNYKVPVLFEMLAEGTISLLGREKLILVQNTWAGGGRFSRPELTYDFYFGFPNGKIRPFRGTRKDFEYLLKGKADQMRQFVQEAGLRYNSKNDLIRIINQYNYLNYNEQVLQKNH